MCKKRVHILYDLNTFLKRLSKFLGHKLTISVTCYGHSQYSGITFL